jgi:hypothetical protein
MNQFPGVDAPSYRPSLDASRYHGEADMFPIDPDHLRTLIKMGLVEMRDDVPVITNAGHQILD